MARLGGRGGGIGLALLAVAVTALSACRVLTIDEDRAIRARRSANFDATAYVDALWRTRLVPTLTARAVPTARLVAAIDADADAAGAKLGRRAGEGSAWTFVTAGEGTVVAADDRSRRGTVDVAIDGAPRVVHLQVGPVVAGTTIRDAADFLAFDDFTDQLAFADVGRALNARALGIVRRDPAALRVGARVRFVGTTAAAAPGEPLLVTPIAFDAR